MSSYLRTFANRLCEVIFERSLSQELKAMQKEIQDFARKVMRRSIKPKLRKKIRGHEGTNIMSPNFLVRPISKLRVMLIASKAIKAED